MGDKEDKKRRKSSPIYFRNFFVNYERKGWTCQDGGVNSNFQIFEPFQNILEAGLLMEEHNMCLSWRGPGAFHWAL